MNKFTAILIAALLAGPTFAKTVKKTIYGKDSRVDIYEFGKSSIRKLGKSTAAMVANVKIKDAGDGTFSFEKKTLVDHGMCSSINFSNQPVLSDCTGFLVAPDLLMTAGHCMLEYSDCANYSWIFDYTILDAKDNSMAMENVYACKRIVSKTYLPNIGIDYAIVQLERAARGRDPFVISKDQFSAGTFVTMLGHPAGLPMKVTSGGNTFQSGENSVMTSLDAFGGNSGSPVVDSTTGELLGVLISGGEDFIYEDGGSCKVEAKCEPWEVGTKCLGEEVMKISSAPVQDVINSRNEESMLMEAIFYNDREVLDYELNENINLNQSYYGWTPLIQAALAGNIDAVQKLIARGVDLNATENSDNGTALIVAIKMEYYDIARLLIDAGADLDVTTKMMNDSALTIAIQSEEIDIATLLIERGARTDIVTKDGYNAADLADFAGIYELTELLSGY